MNEILIAAFALLAGFSMGYAVCDFRRWNREYEAWKAWHGRGLHTVEPTNGPWDNGRVA